jgi:hypothetical protein
VNAGITAAYWQIARRIVEGTKRIKTSQRARDKHAKYKQIERSPQGSIANGVRGRLAAGAKSISDGDAEFTLDEALLSGSITFL